MQKEIHTYFISVCFQYFFAWSFSLTCHGIIVELKGYCACRLSLTVSFCQLSKWNTNLLLELATDKSKLVVAQCKGSRNQGSFLLGESRIQNPGNFVRWIRNPRLWNPEYSSSNATPTKDWNQESTFHKQSSGSQYLESEIQRVESRIQDCLGPISLGGGSVMSLLLYTCLISDVNKAWLWSHMF